MNQQTQTHTHTHTLHRHVRDPYVRAAKKEEFRSRAAFKLKEMQAKSPIIRAGDW
jgi:23S rRNA (uridine2552-2'-O)-methyltransferase